MTRGAWPIVRAGGDYSFADLTGDALAILDHLDVDRADIIGLSLGA